MRNETVYGSEELQSRFDWLVYTAEMRNLGPLVVRWDIPSSMGEFRAFSDYKIAYPPKVLRALASLYREYNSAFAPLVEANREWATDYRYCIASDGSPVNAWVQIDMVGLPEALFEQIASAPQEEVELIVRRSIFEIENSLAMYPLLQEIFTDDRGPSRFKKRFRASLDAVRRRHGKPIALLAVTEQKFAAMKAAEFGKVPEDDLSDDEVRSLTGFDRFFGPDDFREHVEVNGGECRYLLYVRSSDPIERLKRPEVAIDHPLLADPKLRRIIKANSLTMNIDAPEMDEDARINDTKEYMIALDMAFPIATQEEMMTPEFIEYLAKGNDFGSFGGMRLTPEFSAYLARQGVDPYTTITGELAIHAKPLKGTYGCYGHHSGPLNNRKFRSELRNELRGRGRYAIQHEMMVPTIYDTGGKRLYSYIDRLFFFNPGDEATFMGGFRSLLPCDSAEVQAGRLHGNDMTIWAEIS